MFIINKCRRISYEVFVLIFVHDCLIFWRQKMGAVNEETSRTKGRKSDTKSKKKKNISSISLLCCLKTTFFTAIICWSKVLEERHLFGLPHYIFFPPKFVNDVKVTRACAQNKFIIEYVNLHHKVQGKKNFLRVKLNFF